MYENDLTESAIRQYHHIADVFNHAAMMNYEIGKANAKLNNAPPPEPPLLMVVHEDIIQRVEEEAGGWNNPEVYGKCITYEAYQEAFVVPQPPPPPSIGSPIGGPLRDNAPGWFKRGAGDTHQVGQTYTAPDGHKYYLQATITDGPVWYQLS